MKLVIAEKPSVGKAIADVIGADKKEQGYLSGNGYLVSWAIGHLVQTALPPAYDDKYKIMNLGDLPIVPDSWIFEITKNQTAQPQYYLLKKLMNRADVESIICATDAGREGELIFRLIYNHAGCKKPFERLWISSLEPKAIRDGMNSLRPGADYNNLYAAASSRQKSDWLYGINMTRLLSCFYGKAPNGYINIINVGRVQTPTINFIVERQRQIDNFSPQIYYSIAADCGNFIAYTKVDKKASADNIIERCNGKDAYVTKLEQDKKSQSPPLLYDLTSLQRDANKMLGYTAQQTLTIAQALYESKLITYPRTDSRFITSDMEQPTADLIRRLLESNNQIVGANGKSVNECSNPKEDITLDTSRIVNNSNVSDHHALLPTESALKHDLSQLLDEQKAILKLIAWRLLCAVYPPYRYIATKIYLDIEGEPFTATGKQTIDAGFTFIESLLMKEFKPDKKPDTSSDNNPSLPSLSEGDTIQAVKITAKEKQTSPPKPYTEDTLLSAMEHASTDILEAELKEAIKGCGLGTPATRAGIIEGTISNGYIERKGDKKTKTLHPTDKAYALMEVIDDDLKSAVMTAEWENKFSVIESGKMTESDFLKEISDFVCKKVKSYCLIPQTESPFNAVYSKEHPERKPICACPKCGGNVYEGKKTFYCENAIRKDDEPAACPVMMFKEDKFFTNKGKVLAVNMAVSLLSGKKITLKGCKPKDTSKQPYDVSVSIDITDKYVNYKMEFINNTNNKKKGA